MKTKLALAISSILALSACDDYKLGEVASGTHSAGTVAISGDPTTGETLKAIVTDADGFAEHTVAYTWMSAGNAIPGATASSYVVSDYDLETKISVKASYTDNAGYDEVAISEETEVVEIPSVPSDGSVSIDDDEQGAYIGVLLSAEIDDANGVGENEITYVWKADDVVIDGATRNKYRLTEAERDKQVTVSVTYLDNDDYDEAHTSEPTAAVTDAPIVIPMTNVAEIRDESTTDTGELRYKFASDSALTTGKVTLKMFYPEGETETVAINLFDSASSTNSVIAQLRLDTGKLTLRNNTDLTGDIPLGTFEEDTWIDIAITWDTSSTEDAGTYTVTVADLPFGTFTSQNVTPGVEVIGVNVTLSDDTKEALNPILVDNFVVYPDVAGTGTPLLNDDFDTYEVDTELGADQGYNAATFSAKVITVVDHEQPDPVDPGGPGDTPNLLAGSLKDGSSSTSGKLEYKFDTWKIASPIEKGRLTVSFFKESDSISGGDAKDAYIGIGTNGSSSNSDKFIDLRLHGKVPTVEIPNPDYGTLQQRDGAGLEITDPAPVLLTSTSTVIVKPVGTQYNEGEHFELDTWHDVEIIWDSTVTINQLTVIFDGTTYGPFDSAAGTTAVTGLYFKFGDNGAVMTKEFQVDDIKLYSSDSGSEVEVFSEDFEKYEVDDEPTGGSQVLDTTVQERIDG